MRMLAPLALFAALPILGCALPEPQAASEASPPNIVLILADDLGYGDPSCYNAASKITTPRIDGLAREGLRFTDAHSPSSVCSPTRYGILTGRYAWRTKLKRSVLWPYDPPLISKDRKTLPKALRERGYHSACIGKWHLGWDWPRKASSTAKRPSAYGRQDRALRTNFGKAIDFTRRIPGGPTTRGFDLYFGDDVPNHPPFCFFENDRVQEAPDTMRGPKEYGWPGPARKNWDFRRVMLELTKRACVYIEERARSEGPFFLYLPLTAPHTPIAPAKAFQGKTSAGAYGDYVREVDWTVGKVLDTLARCSLEENTIVIFTSDNGSPARDGRGMSGPVGSVKRRYGHDPSRPWRGLKGDVWEGGHRVPLIARWPGRIPRHAQSDALVGLQDLYRSLLDLAAVPLEEGDGPDSQSFARALLGKSKTARKELVLHSLDGRFVLREGPWKFIPNELGSGGFSRPRHRVPKRSEAGGQLYRLDKDPGEQENLWNEQPARVKRMQRRLADLRSAKH